METHSKLIESHSKLIGQLNASQRRQKDYIDQLAVQVHNLEGRWQAAMRAELSRMTSGAENRIRVEVQQHLRNTSDRLQEALKQFAQQEIQDRIAAYERAIVRLRWQCWLLCLFAAMVGVVAWIIG
jgi:phage shock protein A